MRTAFPLLFILLIAGCASTAPREPEHTAAEQAAMEATADSLLALSPGQLSDEEAAWLEAFQAQRAEEDRRGAPVARGGLGGVRIYVSACSVVALAAFLMSL